MLIIIGTLFIILSVVALGWAIESIDLIEFISKFLLFLVVAAIAVSLLKIGFDQLEEDATAAAAPNLTTEQKDENYMRGYRAGIEDMANQRVIVDTVFVYVPKNN